MPRLFISFIITKRDTEFAREKIMALVLTKSSPSFCPSADSGFFRNFIKIASTGKVPLSTMAISATVAMPSSTGAMPGISTTPVMDSNPAHASPTQPAALTR